MLTVNWSDIRPHYGNKQDSFEQLCALLFHRETPWSSDSGSSFVRLGRPDGGVECCWKDPQGRIHAIQSKYFMNALTATQWSQIKESYEAAVRNYETLATFIVCLPQDLPGGRNGKAESARAKWEKIKAAWEEAAKRQGRTITIQLWDNHELMRRLANPVNQGVAAFFFNSRILTRDAFQLHIEGQVARVSTRYHPEVHVEHPLEERIEDLVLTKERREADVRLIRTVLEAARCGELTRDAKRDVTPELSELMAQLSKLELTLAVPTLPNLEAIVDASGKAWSALYNKAVFRNDAERADPVKYSEALKSDIAGRLVESKDPVDAIDSHERLPLMTGQAAMIIGSGGCGKTHLLCHIAKKCVERNVPAVLALGHQLDPDKFWRDIMQEIGGFDSHQEFLGALNAAAEIAECRAIILVDALNESDKHYAWAGTLRRIIADIKPFPYVTVAVSVRDIYRDVVWPRVSENNGYELLQHYGFGEEMDDALAKYLHHYNIAMTDVPPLHSEFSNPLMLSMFCQAIAGEPDPEHKRPPARFDGGLQGFGRIFSTFLNRRQSQLCERNGLDTHRSNTSSPLQDAVDELAQRMAASDSLLIDASDCDTILRKHLFFSKHPSNLILLLEQDGILLRSTRLDGERLLQQVGFAFDRMGAHFVASTWLRPFHDAEAGMRLFEEGSALIKVVENDANRWRMPSIIEALITEWRERFKVELFDSHEGLAEDGQCQHAFLSSLAFGRSEDYTDSTGRWLIKCLEHFRVTPPSSMLQLLPLVGRCRVPRMTSDIHHWLLGQNMAERDAWWTINISWHGEGLPLMPVIQWATEGAQGASRDERLAAATALACCTTTTNTLARPKLTKAIVSVLDSDLSVACSLLERFASVSDPYVLQSVAQATHGACLRADDTKAVVEVARTVVRLWSQKQEWPCDLIIRDELLGILECAAWKEPSAGIDSKAFEPPYGSLMPTDAPAWKQINEWEKDVEHGGAGMRAVISSCIPQEMPSEHGYRMYGDFGRYVVESQMSRFFPQGRMSEDLEWVQGPYPFEPDLAHRWIIGRVKSLGWTPERFQVFESRLEYSGRSTSARERIGKKYQWIAFSEFLARATDNHPIHDRYEREDEPTHSYRYAREFMLDHYCDTSLLLRGRSERHSDFGSGWWDKRVGRSLEATRDDAKWLREAVDFPDVEALIFRRDPTGKEWVTLWGHFDWTAPESVDDAQARNEYRRMWMYVKGQLIRPGDLASLRKWTKRHQAFGDCFDLLTRHSSAKFGELVWSKRAFDDLPIEDGLQVGWTKPGMREWDKPRVPLASRYLNEHDSTFATGSLSALVPSVWLVHNLSLKAGCGDFSFRDTRGECVICNPSVSELGSDALLCRVQQFTQLAAREQLIPIWVVIGEKQVFGSRQNSTLPVPPWFQGLYWMENEKLCEEKRVLINTPVREGEF